VSGSGAPIITTPAADAVVEIVATQWHTAIMDGLVGGAIRGCEAAGARYRVTRVAGAFELVAVAEALARAGAEAVVALGVVIRGDTPHFDYVCEAVTRGLTDVSREHALAVGFGVLTVDTEEQALLRAGVEGSREDKGREAVEAALSTRAVLQQIS
jgi:6,7-dimethyl-8-ribityllumazine synthase